MKEKMTKFPEVKLIIPGIKYCTDNAAMIGAAGYVAYQHHLFGDFTASADPSLEMPGEGE